MHDYAPPVHQDVGYPPVHQDVGHPPVYSDPGYPPVHQELGYSPIHRDISYPPVHQDVGYPPVYQDVAYSPVYEDVAFPPVYQDVGYPSVFQDLGYAPIEEDFGLGYAPLHEDLGLGYLPLQDDLGFIPLHQDVGYVPPAQDEVLDSPEPQVSYNDPDVVYHAPESSQVLSGQSYQPEPKSEYGPPSSYGPAPPYEPTHPPTYAPTYGGGQEHGGGGSYSSHGSHSSYPSDEPSYNSYDDSPFPTPSREAPRSPCKHNVKSILVEVDLQADTTCAKTECERAAALYLDFDPGLPYVGPQYFSGFDFAGQGNYGSKTGAAKGGYSNAYNRGNVNRRLQTQDGGLVYKYDGPCYPPKNKCKYDPVQQLQAGFYNGLATLPIPADIAIVKHGRCANLFFNFDAGDKVFGPEPGDSYGGAACGGPHGDDIYYVTLCNCVRPRPRGPPLNLQYS